MKPILAPQRIEAMNTRQQLQLADSQLTGLIAQLQMLRDELNGYCGKIRHLHSGSTTGELQAALASVRGR